MPVSDEQLQQLEAMLDGQAPAAGPAMPDATQRLTRQRELRSAYFTSLEPTTAEAQSLADRLLAAARAGEATESPSELERERRLLLPASDGNALHAPAARQRFVFALRWGVAAAACAACFLAGWLGRGQDQRPLANNHQTSPAIATATDQASNMHLASNTVKKATVATLYQVALTDSNGKVTAVQTFSTLSQARQFANDVDRWHQHEQDVRSSAPIVVASRF